jgi:imidazolonepropionase-like amidohydrolase
MRKVSFGLLCTFLLSSVMYAALGAVGCGTLLDLRSGRLPADQFVVFDEQSKITAVGLALSTAVPAGVTAIDLSAATCLPGLIDAHTHFTSNPGGSGYAGLAVSVPRQTVIGVKNASRTIRAGFTTVRNVGAQGYSGVALRERIHHGDVEGPRMLVSGPALGITGGHCDKNLLPSEF